MKQAAMVALVIAAGLAGVTAHSAAETIEVDSFLDEPDVNTGDGVCDSDSSPTVTRCTLRAAIMEANQLTGLDVVQLASGDYTLSRVGDGDWNGDLDVRDDLHVIGVAGTVIDGGSIDRIFHVDDADFALESVTLRNGSTPDNGGAVFSNASLLLREVEITACDSAGVGGALHLSSSTASTVLIDNCFIHANQAADGGGVSVSSNVSAVIKGTTISFNSATTYDAGGVRNFGDLYLVNSTLVGNSTPESGGGIYSYGNLKLANTTIYGNMCDLDADGTGTGAGVWLLVGASDVRNTVIAGNLNWNNSVPVAEPDDCDGAFTSAGYNLVGFPGSACTGFSAATNDLVGSPLLDAELEGLDFNGGLGPTCLPEPGSPTIDAGDPTGCRGDVDFDWSTPPTLLTTEQRRYPRTLDDDGDGAAVCNIGAVEGALFADSFESGNATVWSASVP